MKKIFITLLVALVSLSFMGTVSATNCTYDFEDSNTDIGGQLDNCLNGVNLVKADGEMKIEGEFGAQLKKWTNNISLYLGVLAVGSIVFGALMMTLSTGEEEKIKKAKDIVKWGMIGFLGIIFASSIINLVVKIMYSI